MNQNSKQKLKNFAVYHLPMILFALAIIGASSIPQRNLPKIDIISFDKLAHIVEYVLLAWLTFRSFSHISSRISIITVFSLSVLFIIIFAFLDELYQQLIPGRQTELLDFFSDLFGALIVLVTITLKNRRKLLKNGQ